MVTSLLRTSPWEPPENFQLFVPIKWTLEDSTQYFVEFAKVRFIKQWFLIWGNYSNILGSFSNFLNLEGIHNEFSYKENNSKLGLSSNFYGFNNTKLTRLNVFIGIIANRGFQCNRMKSLAVIEQFYRQMFSITLRRSPKHPPFGTHPAIS